MVGHERFAGLPDAICLDSRLNRSAYFDMFAKHIVTRTEHLENHDRSLTLSLVSASTPYSPSIIRSVIAQNPAAAGLERMLKRTLDEILPPRPCAPK